MTKLASRRVAGPLNSTTCRQPIRGEKDVAQTISKYYACNLQFKVWLKYMKRSETVFNWLHFDSEPLRSRIVWSFCLLSTGLEHAILLDRLWGLARYSYIWQPAWVHFGMLQNSPKVDQMGCIHTQLDTYDWDLWPCMHSFMHARMWA
jgi:hypothetical protein